MGAERSIPTEATHYRELLFALANHDPDQPDTTMPDLADQLVATLGLAIWQRVLENPDQPPRGPFVTRELREHLRHADASSAHGDPLNELVRRRILFHVDSRYIDALHPTIVEHLAASGAAEILTIAHRSGNPDGAAALAVESFLDVKAGREDFDPLLAHLVALVPLGVMDARSSAGALAVPLRDSLLQLVAGYRAPGTAPMTTIDIGLLGPPCPWEDGIDDLWLNRHRTALDAVRLMLPGTSAIAESIGRRVAAYWWSYEKGQLAAFLDHLLPHVPFMYRAEPDLDRAVMGLLTQASPYADTERSALLLAIALRGRSALTVEMVPPLLRVLHSASISAEHH